MPTNSADSASTRFLTNAGEIFTVALDDSRQKPTPWIGSAEAGNGIRTRDLFLGKEMFYR